VTFSPPNILAKVGTVFEVQVIISQGSGVGSVPFHVVYDPKVLQFLPPGTEGDFLKRDGASTVYNAQASTLNEVFVALARLGVPTGASAERGVLCTLQFQALSAGATTLAFSEGSVLDPTGQPLPATFAQAVQVNVQ
jgi:hypothetical protein